MYSDGNVLNSIEMLEYIELEDNDNAELQRLYYLNRQRNQMYYFKSKLRLKAGLAILRLTILYCFYYLDGNPFSEFLQKLIGLLFIHEGLVLTNFMMLYTYLTVNRILMNSRSNQIPKFCAYLDVFNNLYIFINQACSLHGSYMGTFVYSPTNKALKKVY